jgi:hypothetical protein
MYLPSSYLFSYLSTYRWDLFLTYLVTKVKTIISAQLRFIHNWVPNSRHSVDGWCTGGCWFTVAPGWGLAYSQNNGLWGSSQGHYFRNALTRRCCMVNKNWSIFVDFKNKLPFFFSPLWHPAGWQKKNKILKCWNFREFKKKIKLCRNQNFKIK